MLKDQVPAEIAEFIANCENADILRFINQKLLMPKLHTIYGARIKQYAGSLQWGDVIFAPWGDGKSYAGMIWDVIDDHSFKAFFFDEGTIKKPKLYTIETKTVSAVAYMADIDAGALSEAQWKDAASEAIMEAHALVIDSDPMLPVDFQAFLDGLYTSATSEE